jgi:prevent-host-death family protein
VEPALHGPQSERRSPFGSRPPPERLISQSTRHALWEAPVVGTLGARAALAARAVGFCINLYKMRQSDAESSGVQMVKASDARQQFSRLVTEVFRNESRVIVEKSGIPVAAIISARDLERLTRLERERADDFGILEEIGRVFEEIPASDLEAEVVRALAEVRAEGERGSVAGA